jgi:phosphatidylinositol glycan class F
LFGQMPKLSWRGRGFNLQTNVEAAATTSTVSLVHTTMAATEIKTKAPKSHPIESWDDGLSPIYTHLHPLLLLGFFYYEFPSLVEKPIDTLPQLAMGVALQLLYLCICIPGSNQAQLPQRGKKKGKMMQQGGDTGFGAKLVVSCRTILLLHVLLY